MKLSKRFIRDYHDKGYTVFDSNLSSEVLDDAVAELDRLWKGSRPRGVSYMDGVRIQGAWKSVPAVKTIATCPTIIKTLHALYGRRPLPFQTLNFRIGSEQKTHADNYHFNSEPEDLLCGVWVALEDIGDKQGGLPCDNWTS